ncbi:MAG: hypothetical protein AAGA56_30285 [Myxococcota bacterium]
MAIDKSALKRKMLALEEEVIAAAEQGYQEWLSSVRIDRDETVEDDDLAQSATNTTLAEQYEQQVHDHKHHIDQIESTSFEPRSTVEGGAIVKLTHSARHLVIAAPTSAFECDGVPYLGVSPQAPIVQAMEGLEQGEAFDFQGREMEIELIR